MFVTVNMRLRKELKFVFDVCRVYVFDSSSYTFFSRIKKKGKKEIAFLNFSYKGPLTMAKTVSRQ